MYAADGEVELTAIGGTAPTATYIQTSSFRFLYL
jgi:hypothetical protein